MNEHNKYLCLISQELEGNWIGYLEGQCFEGKCSLVKLEIYSHVLHSKAADELHRKSMLEKCTVEQVQQLQKRIETQIDCYTGTAADQHSCCKRDSNCNGLAISSQQVERVDFYWWSQHVLLIQSCSTLDPYLIMQRSMQAARLRM